jgi:superfamily II DNA/RNA helicase
MEDKKSEEKFVKIKREVVKLGDEYLVNFEPNYAEERSLEEMKLSEELEKGVREYTNGVLKEIQKVAIEPIIAGRDVVAVSTYQSGKTVALSIAALERVDVTINSTQVLILACTRESAYNNADIIERIGKYSKVKMHTWCGGSPIQQDIDSLESRVHIVVGTTGRVKQMFKKGLIDPDYLKVLIIDDANEISDKGLLPGYRDIFRLLNGDIQIVLFALFSTKGIVNLIKKQMSNSVNIVVKSEVVIPEGVKQYYIPVEEFDLKEKVLADFLSSPNNNLGDSRIVIICNWGWRIKKLEKMLSESGIEISWLYGEIGQSERNKVIRDFKDSKTKILVGVGGLLTKSFNTLKNCTIITCDLHRNALYYLENLNRLGESGTMINLVLPKEINSLRAYEKRYNTEVAEWVFKSED